MSLSRAVVSIALIFLGLSAAFAQQTGQTVNAGVKLPACSQSMIVGTTWHVHFTFGFSCPLNIAGNGTVTAGTCLIPPSPSAFTVPQLTGMLTIDRSCHVTGSVNYTYLDPNNGWGPPPASFQLTMTLWRSSDGSRLSGSALLSYPATSGAAPIYIPVEFIAQ
jgi:hypothetical protein